MNILQKIFSGIAGRPGAPGAPPDAGMEKLLDGVFGPTRGANPDTDRQWARLESALESPAESARTVPEPAPRRFAPAWGLAGAAAVTGAVLLVLYLQPSGGPEYGRYATTRGERSAITLPDNSEVMLNHTSSLEFDPGSFSEARTVTLSGEAYFAIQKSAAPFTVKTGAASVTVTGTKFNVRARDGGYEVGVTEGSVTAEVPAAGGDTAISLAAGDLLVGDGGSQSPSVRRISHSMYPGWTDRMLIFTSMRLSSVCEELSNTFDVRIELGDPALANVLISGAFDARDARTAVSTICSLTGRQYRHEDDAYILY